MRYAEVAPLTIVRQDSTILTYQTPEYIAVGTLVTIPIGTRTVVGVIKRYTSKPMYKTKAIHSVLYKQPLPSQLLETAEWISRYYGVHLATVLQSLVPQGITKKRRITTTPQQPAIRKRIKIVLNKYQRIALQQIEQNNEKTVLLHGVTGSGKTIIYIEAVKQVIAQGKSAVILTPEISLTPQLLAEFSHHFKNIIVTHSQLTEAARHQLWLQALNANVAQVVIGPRSALFLPLAKVGIIVIDESHEPSYKQEQQPRYTTQRVARVLAHAHGAKLILGTATPSVNDYYLAQKSGVIVRLPEKVKSNQKSHIQVVDASRRTNFNRNRLFSNTLISAVARQINDRKQVLLFHNRRGTASSILCESCGWHAACTTCMLPLTLHADISKLRCHICGAQESIPPHCPMCKQADIIFRGVGTKQIEAEAYKLFPKATIARFDADTKQGGRLHNQYQALYDGDIDIIIGTQLLAKGLDLPNLGLVGILQADAGLMLPDFQARERVFQLINQACGRVGRQDHTTEVIVQTFYPKDTVIQAGIAEDYAAFYTEALQERRRGNYPPFTHLLALVCTYKTEAGALHASRKMAKQLRQLPAIEVIGPTPAFYERLRGFYRWQIIVKSKSHQVLQDIAKNTPQPWQVEIDPHSLIS